jgi:SAM-dependent methyltransferase
MGRSILEPGCGNGAIVKAVREWRPNAMVTAVDINETLVDEMLKDDQSWLDGDLNLVGCVGDFLGFPFERRFDLIIGNPPYKMAQEFVERSFDLLTPLGTVAMLLRLNWLASKKRIDFHLKHPADVYVLPRRPSFTGDGSTDASEYAWMVWSQGRGNRWFILEV